jgi:hypothetical protein
MRTAGSVLGVNVRSHFDRSAPRKRRSEPPTARHASLNAHREWLPKSPLASRPPPAMMAAKSSFLLPPKSGHARVSGEPKRLRSKPFSRNQWSEEIRQVSSSRAANLPTRSPREPSRPRKAIESRYAIYLFHSAAAWLTTSYLFDPRQYAWPFVAEQAVRYLCVLSLSFGVAWVSWQVLEAPAQRLRRFFPYPDSEEQGSPHPT